MAKLSGPLLSMGATGSIGKTLVAAKWRGQPYMRQHVVPANPRTTGQSLTRNIFSMLNQFWKLAPSAMVSTWDANAQGRPYLGRNKFIGDNISLLRDDTPLTSMVTMSASPGAKGGSAPSAIALAAGSEAITATLTLPEVPSGWTLTGSQGIAFIDQAPASAWVGAITFEEELSTPQTLAFTGLEASELYVVAAWLKWEKPDGKVAYSVSLADTETPTA